MQTGSISRQDNWARFMQLSSQARMRNDGLSGSAPARQPAATGRVATVNVPQKAAVAAPIPRHTQLSAATYSTARPAVEARVLGGRFDAYA